MGKYEVQQKNFQAVMGTNPSQNVGANLPVDSLTWDEASDYCKKVGMRLPTEAEWEYAARAGTTTPFYWGATLSGKEANFCDSTCALNIREPRVTDGFKHTAPVGSFPPNPFGLYDMAGNVSEWIQDWMGVEGKLLSDEPGKGSPGPRTRNWTRACGWIASVRNPLPIKCIGAARGTKTRGHCGPPTGATRIFNYDPKAPASVARNLYNKSHAIKKD